jgi:hypothetical protein
VRARKERAEKDVGGRAGAAASDVGEIVTIRGIRYRIVRSVSVDYQRADGKGSIPGVIVSTVERD